MGAGLLVLAMSGCGDQGSAESPDPTNSTSSPTSTATLPPDEQEAVAQATEAVRAYEQALVDVYADPTPDPNDLAEFAVDPQLTQDRDTVEKTAARDELSFTSTGPVSVDSPQPESVDLTASPNVIVLEACVDQTLVEAKINGSQQAGWRESLQFRVVRATAPSGAAWLVAQVLPPAGHENPQPC